MNRNLLFRFLAVGPLVPLFGKVTPALTKAEELPWAENPVAADGWEQAVAYVSGMAPSGESIYRFVGSIPYRLYGSASTATIAAEVRALEKLAEMRAKFPFLDRIEVHFERYAPGMASIETRHFHAPLIAGKLPLGWAEDLTGFFTTVDY